MQRLEQGYKRHRENIKVLGTDEVQGEGGHPEVEQNGLHFEGPRGHPHKVQFFIGCRK